MCSKKKSLAVELYDLSQAEKEIIACKAEQINKMTPIIVSWLKSHKNLNYFLPTSVTAINKFQNC